MLTLFPHVFFPTICLKNMCACMHVGELFCSPFCPLCTFGSDFSIFLSAFGSLLKCIFPSFELQEDSIYYEYYELLKSLVLFKVVSVFIQNVSVQWYF